MKKPAIAAAVIAAIAVAGLGVLYAFAPGNDIGSGPMTNPTEPPTSTPLPSATPGALPLAASLAPGTYVLSNPFSREERKRGDWSTHCAVGCADYETISVTLPDGWATTDGLIYKHLGQPNELALSVWTPEQIYPDPCHWQDAPPAWTGDEQQWWRWPTMLQEQVGRQGSIPTAVRFGHGDYEGFIQRVELMVPADLDIRTCDQGQYRAWSELVHDDGANSHHAPGQSDVVYVVLADRRPFLIDASHGPQATTEDRAELTAILDSMVIDRGL